MAKKYYDVSNITISDTGKVKLKSDDLVSMEKEQVQILMAGGQEFTPRPDETQMGINWFTCDGMRNAGQNCYNGWSCEGASNVDHCLNVWDCDAGVNTQECSNSRSCG
jgi:uncharacterized membrane protein